MPVPHSVILFSPMFKGSDEAWAWLCDVTNGRQRPPPADLTNEQRAYAKAAGYIPNLGAL